METLEMIELDPRVRRTRVLLKDALEALLRRKSFDSITVQDITTEATVSRATFYAHYPDKYELLKVLTDTRFQSLLDKRGVRFDGTCESALHMILLGVCDYLVGVLKDQEPDKKGIDPYLETAIIAVVERMSIEGLKQQPSWTNPLSLEMVASAVSWGLYGAARNWVYQPNRKAIERVSDKIVSSLALLIHAQV